MYEISSSCQIDNLNEIYIKYFGYPSKGTFVEVGAYDGEFVSNTSCLADHGWKGLYVEPIREYYLKCLDRHSKNDVIVENCAIGVNEGQQEIVQSDTLSTLNEKHYKMFESIGWVKNSNITKTICDVVRLDNLLEKNNISNQFDLLVVDVEGYELEVFNSFDLHIWKPKMIIVEMGDEHPEFTQFEEYVSDMKKLTDNILSGGYEKIYKDHINTIFIKGS